MRSLPSDLEAFVFEFLETTGTPRALTVAILLRYGEFRTVASLKCDPACYLTAHSFALDYQATSILSKYPGLLPRKDCVDAAKESFVKAENACHKANLRLSLVRELPSGASDWATHDIMSRARKKMCRWLGPIPDELEYRFGPGATYDQKRQAASLAWKISSRFSVTESAKPYMLTLGGMLGRIDRQRGQSPLVVRGNRFTTVPKTSITDRGICVEPGFNIMFQLGIAKAMRRYYEARMGLIRLRPGIHGLLAKSASVSNSLATIDLSSASDTISKELVRWLLPAKWYCLLSDFRSPFTELDGKWRLNEKFSSMGNGFTFELETMIFHALVTSVLEYLGLESSSVSVFGDDIICPTTGAREVIAFLRFAGFEINAKKTFLNGNFRETCGQDFFNGSPVRPFFLRVPYPRPPRKKDEFSLERFGYAKEQWWLSTANQLYKFGSDVVGGPGFLGPYHRLHRSCLSRLRYCVRRVTGPSFLGDIVVASESWPRKWRNGIPYIKVLDIRSRSIKIDRFDAETQLALAVYGVPSSGISDSSIWNGGFSVIAEPYAAAEDWGE